jgi:hypothetical protein
LEWVIFIGNFNTNAALKRIEKNEKMRRTGHKRRRTGQRSENGGENESGFFRQEDRIFRIYRKIYGGVEVTQHGMLIEL